MCDKLRIFTELPERHLTYKYIPRASTMNIISNFWILSLAFYRFRLSNFLQLLLLLLSSLKRQNEPGKVNILSIETHHLACRSQVKPNHVDLSIVLL